MQSKHYAGTRSVHIQISSIEVIQQRLHGEEGFCMSQKQGKHSFMSVRVCCIEATSRLTAWPPAHTCSTRGAWPAPVRIRDRRVARALQGASGARERGLLLGLAFFAAGFVARSSALRLLSFLRLARRAAARSRSLLRFEAGSGLASSPVPSAAWPWLCAGSRLDPPEDVCKPRPLSRDNLQSRPRRSLDSPLSQRALISIDHHRGLAACLRTQAP